MTFTCWRHVTHSYHAYQSVNFVTSHDGFTLHDLVSYDRKHNEANGEANIDGTDNNISWNCGWEGDDNVPPDVAELRKRQIKNYCCILFLSNGTPMFVAGDEFMRSQHGNNNPYNQDNETSWIDWRLLERNKDIFRFFQRLIEFRKRHPTLCRSRFWREDVFWYGAQGQVDQSPSSHQIAYFLSGQSQQDVDLYVMINAGAENASFSIPQHHGQEWRRVIDTSLPSPDDVVEPGREELLKGAEYLVEARSVVVLLH